MSLNPPIVGSIQTIVNLDGVLVTNTLQPGGNTICKPLGSLPPGLPSSGNWTRTSDTVATDVTFTAHGLAGTENVALFWNGGYCYDVAVTVVDPNTLTLTVPAGQIPLPAANTAMLLAVAQDVTNSVSIVGSDLQQLLITSTQPGICELLDATPAQQRLSVIAVAGGSDFWPTATDQTPPFSQTVVKARMYNNSQTSAVMTVVALLA